MRSLVLFLLLLPVFAQEATIHDQELMLERYKALVVNPANAKTSMSVDQRKELLKIISQDSVASLASISLYDPPQNDQPIGEIGYCYGRAMAGHLYARKLGLDDNSIKKIFAAGDMQNGTVRWRFHMATVVPDENGKLFAVDPIMPGLIRRYNNEFQTDLDPMNPLDIETWMKIVKKYYDNTEAILAKNPGLADNPDFKGTVKFYLTNSEPIMVDMREVPANLELENGRRIIEVLFNPDNHSGFTKLPGEEFFYEVDDPLTLRAFFTTPEESLADQFNFYRMDVDIFYILDDVAKETTRNYLYNGKQPGEEEFQHFSLGYFPSLLKNIENYVEVINE